MTVVFDRMIEGCCFILYWFFPSSTPRDVHFFWFDTTALQVRTDLEDTRVSNESPPWSNNTRFYFFQQWNVLKGFWFQKEAYVYIYTYIHMNIYIYRKSGDDFWNFLPKKLLSYEVKVIPNGFVPKWSVSKCCGKLSLFFVGFSCYTDFCGKSEECRRESQHSSSHLLTCRSWDGLKDAWNNIHPRNPNSSSNGCLLRKKSSSQGFHVNLGLINHPVS